MTYALAAAGTGGHVYPALAVADALVASGVPTDDILFIGGDRMEARAVPAAGYDFVPVEMRGLRRSLSPENLSLPRVVRRARQAITEQLEARHVTVMTVFGGYVAVPAAGAARRVKATLFVQEQNAVPGLANRLVARRAAAAFVGFPDAAAKLPRAQVTGNPLRASFAHFDRATLITEARRRYGLPAGVPVLGVLGGSLGARVLNEVTIHLADTLDADRIAIVHLTGRSHLDEVETRASRSPTVWTVRAFEDEMTWFYAAADLVLSRAGALTISELAATGTPAVVVPYALGTAGHQAANAAALEQAGGVVVMGEGDIDRVPAAIEQLIGDPAQLRMMADAARAQGRPDAAEVIAAALRAAAVAAGGGGDG
jgi:UDP-N-acetylglucosamine--N-acetylmuramyl-(pentapeptide) pyrophosphoryl-undecaprenol N-acetylglucosamine transferase